MNFVDGGDGWDSAYYPAGHFEDNTFISIENFTIIYPPKEHSTGAYKEAMPVIGGRILLINVLSEQIVQLNALHVVGYILRLPEGNQVYIPSGISTKASLTAVLYSDLPGAIPMSFTLVDAMQVNLWDGEVEIDVTTARIKVSFVIPAWLKSLDLVILYWDETLNNGEGAWIEVESGRSPAWLLGEKIDRQEAWVNQTGIYMLAVRNLRGSLACEDALTLELPNGNRLMAACGVGDEALLAPLQRWNLPVLPAGESFLSAIQAGVYNVDGSAADAAMRVSFVLPDADSVSQFGIRYWNDELQQWEPVSEAVVADNRLEAEVAQSGTYGLVSVIEPVSLNCDAESTSIELGTVDLTFACVDDVETTVYPMGESQLPYLLPFETDLIAGVSVEFTTESTPFTISIPYAGNSEKLHLLLHDPSLGWLAVDGFVWENGMISAQLDSPGTYVLVEGDLPVYP